MQTLKSCYSAPSDIRDKRQALRQSTPTQCVLLRASCFVPFMLVLILLLAGLYVPVCREHVLGVTGSLFEEVSAWIC